MARKNVSHSTAAASANAVAANSSVPSQPSPIASTSKLPEQQQTHIHHYEHDPMLGIDACTSCGDVSSTSTSTQLHVLGRTTEDETIEKGRRYLASMTGYVGDRPQLKGRSIMGLGVERSLASEAKWGEVQHRLKAILAHFGMLGLLERVKGLFLQAKERKRFRWGKKADIIAVACIYLVAKEANRSLTLVDLSSVTELDFYVLTRVQNSLKKWLNLSISTYEPIIFLEDHLVHLSSVVKKSYFSTRPPMNLSRKNWSTTTMTSLRKVDWLKVRSLSTSLLELISELELPYQKSAEHLAVAIVVISIEASIRTKLSKSLELFEELTKRVDISHSTAQARYREIWNALTEYAKRLPWDVEIGQGRKGDIAPLIEDVLRFRSLLQKRAPNPGLNGISMTDSMSPEETNEADGEVGSSWQVDFESEMTSDLDEEGQMEEENDNFSDIAPDPLRRSESPSRRIKEHSVTPAPNWSSSHLNVDKSRSFLKRPIDSVTARRVRTLESVSSSLKSTLSSHGVASVSPSTASTHAPHSAASIRLRQLILSGVDASKYLNHPSFRWSSDLEAIAPEEESTSRLDRLLWSKECDEIEDDELFDEGEMEAFLRNDDEIDNLKRTKWYQEMPDQPEWDQAQEEKASLKRKRRESDLARKREQMIVGENPVKRRKRSKLDQIDKALLEKLLESGDEDVEGEEGNDGADQEVERALMLQRAVEDALREF